MSGPEAWFIDEDLLGLADVLARARRKFEDVHWVGDGHPYCPTLGTPDTVWASNISGRGWAVIRKDVSSRKRSRPAEFYTFQEHEHGVFVLRARRAGRFEQTRIVLRWWDELNAFWDAEPKHFFARFSRTQSPHAKPQG